MGLGKKKKDLTLVGLVDRQKPTPSDKGIARGIGNRHHRWTECVILKIGQEFIICLSCIGYDGPASRCACERIRPCARAPAWTRRPCRSRAGPTRSRPRP